jgi:hypothetical protein
MSTSSSAPTAAMNTPSSSPPLTPSSTPVTELKAPHTELDISALGDALHKTSERTQQKPKKDFPADADTINSIELLRAPFDIMQATMQHFHLKRTYTMCTIVNVDDGLRAFAAAENSLRSFLSNFIPYSAYWESRCIE